MDFGNTEVVSVADVRPMEAALAAVAPLATAAQLAYVRVPDLADAEWGVTAAEVLSDLVGGGAIFHTKVLLTRFFSVVGVIHKLRSSKMWPRISSVWAGSLSVNLQANAIMFFSRTISILATFAFYGCFGCRLWAERAQRQASHTPHRPTVPSTLF